MMKIFQIYIINLKQRNLSSSKRIQELESRLEDMKQYSRENCIDINVVHEEKEQNVTDVVKKIDNSLGVQIEENMLDTFHHLGLKQGVSVGRMRGIICKFARRLVKEELLRKRRVKRDLNIQDIGISERSVDVIYI